VPTGYNYEMPDEKRLERALHFEAAWVAVLAGLVYGIYGLLSGHFKKDLIPARRDWNWPAYRDRIAKYLRRAPPDSAEERSYNVLQRTAYIVVIFGLFPLIIWTGLAMSPSFTAAFLGRRAAGRPSVGAHHSLLCYMASALVSLCACRDGGVVGIQKAHAGHDHGVHARSRGEPMNRSHGAR